VSIKYFAKEAGYNNLRRINFRLRTGTVPFTFYTVF